MKKENGYLLKFAVGIYSSREEYVYVFDELPDFEKIKGEIDVAWRGDPGEYNGNLPVVVRDIIEKHGGVEANFVGEIWTDDYGTGEATMNIPELGIDVEWEQKENEQTI